MNGKEKILGIADYLNGYRFIDFKDEEWQIDSSNDNRYVIGYDDCMLIIKMNCQSCSRFMSSLVTVVIDNKEFTDLESVDKDYLSINFKIEFNEKTQSLFIKKKEVGEKTLSDI